MLNRRIPEDTRDKESLELVRRAFISHCIEPGSPFYERLEDPKHADAKSLVTGLAKELESASSNRNSVDREPETRVRECDKAMMLVNTIASLVGGLLQASDNDARSAKAARKKVRQHLLDRLCVLVYMLWHF